MRRYFEPVAWTTALILLFFMNPSTVSGSFCIFKLVGFDACPGCGIGHAIHHALHLDFQQSFREHILGIPATIAILYNVINSLLHLKQTHPTWTPSKCS